MKHIIQYTLIALLVLTSCKPEEYKGPLSIPTGTWKGVASTYTFNGETVAEEDKCEFSIITFYEMFGLCCIEGIKGEKIFTFNQDTNIIQIDSTLWYADKLTGEEIIMTYTGKIYRESPSFENTEDLSLPIEYKGVEINADTNDYFYKDEDGNTVYCHYHGEKNEEGIFEIDFWYDSHTDRFTPYKPPVKK